MSPLEPVRVDELQLARGLDAEQRAGCVLMTVPAMSAMGKAPLFEQRETVTSAVGPTEEVASTVGDAEPAQADVEVEAGSGGAQSVGGASEPVAADLNKAFAQVICLGLRL
jgi:hypothetical protein